MILLLTVALSFSILGLGIDIVLTNLHNKKVKPDEFKVPQKIIEEIIEECKYKSPYAKSQYIQQKIKEYKERVKDGKSN